MTEPGAATLVVGLGNPILGDDGVGWAVAAVVADAPGLRDVEVERLSLGGIALMERLLGRRRAVIVDAVLDGVDPVGTVRVRRLDAVETRTASHLDSSHDTSIRAALAAASELGGRVPEDIVVVSVAIERADRFGESLSRPVASAVRPAADAVQHVLATLPERSATGPG